ncbi:hypothetical protein AC244_32525 [Ensifer adhaerens]|uniref:Capsular polysaccharide transport system permease protein n=1 Tax=Ensifer adhaerens TaxID=106592 RepID=A0A0L8BEH4_ENSAD|nr:hypothetical protein [Ensifer adhaerens]KOF12964.1 hypothetical protein AC244_32525 [Ensifer adhaerens]
MRDDNQLIVKSDASAVVGRSLKMAAALSSYARALTFENRSRRNLYRLAGLAPRARDRVFSVLLMVIVGVTFVLPMGASIVYYAFIASPGYVSEVRFIVRSSAPMLSRDRYSSSTVEPKAKIVQDTAVLLNYLGSPSVIQDLQKNIDLRQVFGRDDIDFFSRLSSDATQDEILEYWKDRSSASVNPKSGIVELEVTAFTPKEAHDLVNLVLRLSEGQINRLSSGMWDDLLVSAQGDVDTATGEVADLRGKLRDTQNRTGIFDVDLSAESIITVLTGIESDIAQLKSRRDALSQSLERGAPQLSDMDRRLAALEEEARKLGARTAGSSSDDAGNLADYSRVFDKLKLDLKIAESKLQSAISELEKVKLVSSLQLVYVDNFTDPTLPDKSTFPNVPLALLLWFLLWTTVCGSACGAVLLMRNKLD